MALQKCGDDMRLLQLEVGELQRRLFATHKTAPDVVAYDRQIAALKAEVMRARAEAEGLGAALESPKECGERWRVLGGKLPAREDLAARIGQIEERLAARRELAAQVGGWDGECTDGRLGRVTCRARQPVGAFAVPRGPRHFGSCHQLSLQLATLPYAAKLPPASPACLAQLQSTHHLQLLHANAAIRPVLVAPPPPFAPKLCWACCITSSPHPLAGLLAGLGWVAPGCRRTLCWRSWNG